MHRRASKVGIAGATLLFGLTTTTYAVAADPWLASGQSWSYRAAVTLTEPGVADRTAEYVDVLVDFSGGVFTSLPTEVRVADAAGVEIPSLVHHVDVAGKKARVLFAKSINKSASDKVYVYWGNAAAAAPAYAYTAMKVVFYAKAAAYDATYEQPVADAIAGLKLHGKVDVAVTPVVYTSYSSAGAQGYRLGVVSLLPSVVDAMAGSTVYDDIGIAGFATGDYLTKTLFGIVSDSQVVDGSCTVPAATTYVTQDFAANATLDFTWSTNVIPGFAAKQDTGSVIEVVAGGSPTGASLLRWDAGHAFPNAKSAKYRGFFFDQLGFSTDATTLLKRMFEYVLQDNRITVAQGTTDVGRNCYADADKDGFGAASLFTINQVCNDTANGVADNALDCDDTKAAVKPGGTEICNGIDDDCDGAVDEGGDALCGTATSGKICSESAKACIDGCGVPVPGTVDAGPDAATVADAGDGGRVVTGARNGCPAGLFCSVTQVSSEGQCTMSCVADAQCVAVLASKPFCVAAGEAGSICVECRDDADCSGKVCNASHVCVAPPADAGPDASGDASSDTDASGSSSSSSSSSSGGTGTGFAGDTEPVAVSEPNGCGCRTTGAGDVASSAPLLAVAALAFARIFGRRRR